MPPPGEDPLEQGPQLLGAQIGSGGEEGGETSEQFERQHHGALEGRSNRHRVAEMQEREPHQAHDGGSGDEGRRR